MISLIICSIAPAKLAAVESMYRAALANEPWELIAITDARSLAEGYNRGVAQSRGEILVFSHDDVEVLSPIFPQRLLSHLERFDLIGVAGTRRVINALWVSAGPPEIFGQIVHPRAHLLEVEIFGAPRPVVGGIQALDGVFMAARRSVLDRVRFDAETFDRFHFYDIDFSYQAYQAGLRLAVANDIHLLHRSGGRADADWSEAARRFEAKWQSSFLRQMGPRFQWATVQVETREQALRIMTPSFWNGPT